MKNRKSPRPPPPPQKKRKKKEKSLERCFFQLYVVSDTRILCTLLFNKLLIYEHAFCLLASLSE